MIPVLASILILGTIGLTQDAFAGNKLFVGGLSWDTDSQSFEVEIELQRGMAKALQKADFSIPVELTINSPELSEDVVLAKTLSGNEVSSDEFGKIKVKFPWDRSIPDGSSFEGTANIAVEAKILNPAGKTVGNSVDKFERVLTITLPNTPPTIESVSMIDILDRVILDGGLVLSGYPTECRANSVDDADGDIVTISYEWFKEDGTLVFTEQDLPAQIGPSIGIADQDRIFCRATPFDGTDFGNSVDSVVGIYHYAGGTAGL